ncbi:MAG: PD-(D/E)XK nuclease family protein [Kiritimatiellaeota bacterium]|nr:PD-(D/E)XK nuclease family protein [Kiritimatiellota bacterium]
MPLQRHFLDWDASLTERVCAWLLPARLDGPADVRADLIVVPTAQAGRRLREALARCCAEQQTALLAGRVVTPAYFFESRAHPGGAASAALVASAWAAVLLRLDSRLWRALFPAPPPERTLDWALRLGARLQQLRETLADGGWRIADVPAAAGAALEEPERWQDLARLEDAYRRVLAGADREDPCARKLRLAEAPELPPDIRRIVVAGVTDPSGLALRALGHLSRRLAVDILIHAPAELADLFDEWGRPRPDPWTRRLIAIPEPERNIRTAATPAGQAAVALEIVREEAHRFDTASTSTGLSAGLAVGVPDAALIPFLETALAQAGVPTFNPAAIPLPNTELFQAIAALCRLHTEGTYAAFSEAIRQADVLDLLQRRAGVAAADVLAALDDFHRRHLPQSWWALRQQVAAQVPADSPGQGSKLRKAQTDAIISAEESAAGILTHSAPEEEMTGTDAGLEAPPTGKIPRHAPLALAIPVMEELLAPLGHADPLAGLRQMLLTLYAGRVLPAGAPAARRFADAAAAVDAVLHEVAELPDELGADRPDRLAILLQRLTEAALEPIPAAEAVDLEGWLELPWNDAPLMIVTGVNEGRLPESRLGDLFLPDSLRHSLRLRDNESRYARDAYLLASLLATRQARGRLVLISGRASAEGDPLKPSRLLFRCPDAELAVRVRRLLSERPAVPHGGAPQVGSALRRDSVQASSPQASFKLNPCPAGAPNTAAFLQQPFAVTAFRDYLACPFRFYLHRVLRIEALDDQATALDARGFGALLHAALQRVFLQPDLRACEREDVLAGELCRAAAACAHGQWGPQLSPLVALQLAVAGQRLRAAARVQAELARQGWEIQACEQKLEFDMEGVTLRARVDRLDRHRTTGAWRIVDYKTSDQSDQPAAVHLGRARDDTRPYALTADGKQRWQDLQLPLYLHALPPEHQSAAELAYFNLPKALENTALSVWDGFSSHLRQSAEACARGVLADIRSGRFWPPTENPPHDDFERLFTAAPEDCFHAKLLKR